jgi:hypothetical protein
MVHIGLAVFLFGMIRYLRFIRDFARKKRRVVLNS